MFEKVIPHHRNYTKSTRKVKNVYEVQLVDSIMRQNVLGCRIQPVSFVGRKLMRRGIGFLLRLWKTCGLKQIQKCCGGSRSTITSGKTMGNQPACLKRSGMSSSAVPAKTSRHVCVSVDPELTGLTATRMTRGDDLPRHMQERV